MIKLLPNKYLFAALTIASIFKVVMSPLHTPTFHSSLSFFKSFQFIIVFSAFSYLNFINF